MKINFLIFLNIIFLLKKQKKLQRYLREISQLLNNVKKLQLEIFFTCKLNIKMLLL